MSESFGKWLETQRKERGLNQTDFARLSRMTKATMSLYEADKVLQPRLHQLDKIAKVLGLSRDEVRAEFFNRNVSNNASSLNLEIAEGVRVSMLHGKDLSNRERSRFEEAFKMAYEMALRMIENEKQISLTEAAPSGGEEDLDVPDDEPNPSRRSEVANPNPPAVRRSVVSPGIARIQRR